MFGVKCDGGQLWFSNCYLGEHIPSDDKLFIYLRFDAVIWRIFECLGSVGSACTKPK